MNKIKQLQKGVYADRLSGGRCKTNKARKVFNNNLVNINLDVDNPVYGMILLACVQNCRSNPAQNSGWHAY